MHASRYKEPDQLPTGAVLIVGSGASGAQIAEELLEAGRRVYLSVGRHRRMPRRYRGHDLIWWLETLGLDQTPVEKRGPERALPLITGANGGHTIDFRQMAARGVTLLGKVTAARKDAMGFAPDLAASLAHGDAAYSAFLDLVDAHVERERLDMPEEPDARMKLPDPPYLLDPLRHLDFKAAGIGAIIWATGYGYDYELDQNPGARCTRRAGSPPRRDRYSRHVLPWPAMAVRDELLVPVRRRGRLRQRSPIISWPTGELRFGCSR